MRLPMDGQFFCQTIRDGAVNLSDPLLMQAIVMMHPVVILDTAIRFQQGDENSSTDQAQGLGAQIFKLITGGAQAVICMHHRKKSALNEETSLENALRGSGDFGATSDCVWAVEHARKRKGKGWDDEYMGESKQLTRLFLQCVKPRDMEPADPFVIQGRPHIDQKGDFIVLDEKATISEPEMNCGDDKKVLSILKSTPAVSMRALVRDTGFGHEKIERIASQNNFEKINGVWQHRNGDELGLEPTI